MPKAAFLGEIDALRAVLHAEAYEAHQDDYYAKLRTLKILDLLVAR